MTGDIWSPVGLAVVHPWLCDVMGHMATRHYAALFEDASYQLFARFAPPPEEDEAAGFGWADIRHEIDYKAEIGSGALLALSGRVSAIGRTSLQCEYRVCGRKDDRLHALMTARTVRFDLRSRRASVIDDAMRAAITSAFGISG